MAYSMDLRERVLAAVESGQTVASVARRFEVQECTVRIWRHRAASGKLAADKPGTSRPKKLTDADLQLMREQVAANPGITLLELRDMLSVHVAESTVSRALKKMNISFKKNR